MEPWVVFGKLLCLSIANLNVIKVTCRQNKPTSKIWIFKKPERKGPRLNRERCTSRNVNNKSASIQTL